MSLLGRNALYSAEMMQGRIFLSLLAKVLDTNLYTTLHKLISWKPPTIWGFLGGGWLYKAFRPISF